MMTRLRQAVLATAVVVGMGLLPTMVFADQPTVTTTTLVNSPVFTYPAGTVCSFEVVQTATGTIIATTYVDKTASTVRQLLRSPQLLYTFSANGKSLTALSPASEHVDISGNTATFTGDQFIITVPGTGVIVGFAGRQVVDLTTGNTISFTGLQIANL